MARPVAILRALALAYRRDWTAFQSLAGNNFFLITAFLLRQAGIFVYLIMGLVRAVSPEYRSAAQDSALAPGAVAAGTPRALDPAPGQSVDQSAHVGTGRARHVGRRTRAVSVGLWAADRGTIRRRVPDFGHALCRAATGMWRARAAISRDR